MSKLVKTILNFFTKDIWDTTYDNLGVMKRMLYSFSRIVMLSIRGFIGDRCTLQSCALTYITLVSIVPVLALTLSFCKGIGMQRKLLASLGLRQTIHKVADPAPGKPEFEISYEVVKKPQGGKVAKQQDSAQQLPPGTQGAVNPGLAAELPEPMQLALENVFIYVDKTNFAAIGIIGLVTLLSTVIASIKKLENIFNKIWRVNRGRPLQRQFCEYLVVLLFLPVVMLFALSVQGFITSGQLYEMLHTDSAVVLTLGHIIAQATTVFFIILAFAFLYIFMPNTKVKFGAACLGGLVASICFWLVLCAYIKWQLGLAKYNAIYGTFAALPFFLAWLYANWIVVLLGAEISFAAQNHRLLRADKNPQPLDPGACHLLGIVIMNDICKSFVAGKGVWNAVDFARNHAVPITELEIALAPLHKSNLVLQLSPLAPPPKCYEYLPARPPQDITLHDVAEAFTGLDSDQARRIGQYLPETLKDKLIDHHKRMVADLDFSFH